MELSNQFPVKGKTKSEPMPTNQKAAFIFNNMKEHMPNLYEMIKRSKR